jgi:tetratricopeptide (TPR) repeat protein
MASDREQSDGHPLASAGRSLRPPPKPNRLRPAAAVPDEDPTVRVFSRETGADGELLIPTVRPGAPAEPPALPEVAAASDPDASSSALVRLPAPPPLPSASRPSPVVALEIPKNLAGARRLLGGRYPRIGAIFAVGVLVGSIGAVSVMRNRAAPVVEGAVLAATSTPDAAKRAPAAPGAKAIEPAPEPERGAKPESAASGEVDGLNRESLEPPVSGSTAPSCRQLLGKSLVERHDPKAALRETLRGKRELVRGNVPEAQAAYCKALAWDRSNIDRRVNLGRLFLVRRDWEKAAEYGQSALKLDPKSRRALAVVGDAWAALHKTKQARAAMLAAERKPNPGASELALIVRRDMALARRVERLQDFTLAERLYRRVLLLEPEHTGAMKGIASCLHRIGDHRAAEIWARRAEAPRGSATGSRQG